MSTHRERVQNYIKGKAIKDAYVTGCGIILWFTDGSVFDYEATDGGYSTFEVYDSEEEWESEE